MRQLDLVAVSLVLVAGGLVGDHASYWIGRRHGGAWLARMERVPVLRRAVTPRQRARGRLFMRRRGAAAVFLARFAGPVSWVTPMLAGIHRMPYARFARFNAPAVLLGIGQFIVLGYLVGRHAGDIPDGWRRYAWLALPLLAVLLLALRGLRRSGSIGPVRSGQRTRGHGRRSEGV